MFKIGKQVNAMVGKHTQEFERSDLQGLINKFLRDSKDLKTFNELIAEMMESGVFKYAVDDSMSPEKSKEIIEKTLENAMLIFMNTQSIVHIYMTILNLPGVPEEVKEKFMEEFNKAQSKQPFDLKTVNAIFTNSGNKGIENDVFSKLVASVNKINFLCGCVNSNIEKIKNTYAYRDFEKLQGIYNKITSDMANVPFSEHKKSIINILQRNDISISAEDAEELINKIEALPEKGGIKAVTELMTIIPGIYNAKLNTLDESSKKELSENKITVIDLILKHCKKKSLLDEYEKGYLNDEKLYQGFKEKFQDTAAHYDDVEKQEKGGLERMKTIKERMKFQNLQAEHARLSTSAKPEARERLFEIENIFQGKYNTLNSKDKKSDINGPNIYNIMNAVLGSFDREIKLYDINKNKIAIGLATAVAGSLGAISLTAMLFSSLAVVAALSLPGAVAMIAGGICFTASAFLKGHHTPEDKVPEIDNSLHVLVEETMKAAGVEINPKELEVALKEGIKSESHTAVDAPTTEKSLAIQALEKLFAGELLESLENAAEQGAELTSGGRGMGR